MLRKLLKYEIKSYANILLPIYGINLLLAVFTKIFVILNDITPTLRFPIEFVCGIAVFSAIAMPCITFAIGIEKFNKQITKDEGYLIHTLPLKEHTIIDSSLITQFLFQTASLIVSANSILIIGFIKLSEIKNIIEELEKLIREYSILTPILLLLIMLIGYAVIVLLIYTAISFGQKHDSNKTKFAILYGIILYIIQKVFTYVMYIPLLMNKTFKSQLENAHPTALAVNITLSIMLLNLSIISVTYYLLTTRNLERKLNLE